MPLLLTESDVRRVLDMKDLIAAMEATVARFSAGGAHQPVRMVVPSGDTGGFFGLMPAYLSEPRSLGAKLVTLFNSNTARGLPSHLATIVLMDPDTGALLAILDGRFITEARTAAVSAVTAKHLARADAAELAIIGSGVQATSHLEAVPLVRRLSGIRVWSPTPAHREAFVRSAASHSTVPVRACATAQEALRDADLVVLATASLTPVVQKSWISPGAHVMCVGACRPDWREMDPALVAAGRLFVDSRVAALVESGDVLMGIREGLFGPDHIVGEIGELVAGRVEGRRSPQEITIFKSLGMAVEDVASADLAYRRAREVGVGTEITL